jgi:glucose/arabinose dehydrogenase
MRHSVRWLAGLALLLPVSALAGMPPDVHLTEIVSSGLNAPVAIASPNDGSGRLFVVDSSSGTGKVLVVESDGTLLSTPFYTHPITGGPNSEQGMLGLAFDPDFATNGEMYLTYTAPGSDPRLGAEPDQVLIRLTADAPSANVFSGDETVVLRIPDRYWNHNGGNIQFGPDGYLYWGMGDGGSGGDPNGFAQDLWKKTSGGNTYYLLGKIMRLDVRNPVASAPVNQCGATQGQPAEYSIPSDNPYAADPAKCGEIWLYGVRNPWRWSFDRVTGDFIVGDVGQNAWEEIDFRAQDATGNNNYGWVLCEGNHYEDAPGSGTDCPESTGTLAPVVELSHSNGNFAIVGGYVYRGPIASLEGQYIFADTYAGNIYIAPDPDPEAAIWTHEVMTSEVPLPYSFGEDDIGNLYVLGGGSIYRFDSDAPPVTWIVTPLAGLNGSIDPDTPQIVDEGETTEFTITPDTGYLIDTVTGCGGTLVDDTYTTAPVTADCTVEASFVLDDTIFENGFDGT